MNKLLTRFTYFEQQKYKRQCLSDTVEINYVRMVGTQAHDGDLHECVLLDLL